MTTTCDHNCGDEPLTREEALDEAFDLIERGADEAAAGRPAEASVFNSLAQTSIALADRLGSGLAVLTGGPH